MAIGYSSSSFFTGDYLLSTLMVDGNQSEKVGQLGLHDEQSNGNVRSVNNKSLKRMAGCQVFGRQNVEELGNIPGHCSLGSTLEKDLELEGKFYLPSDCIAQD